MSKYTPFSTPWGVLRFNLENPYLFKDQTCATRGRAIEQLRTLDGRSCPKLGMTPDGQWAIWVRGSQRSWERVGA